MVEKAKLYCFVDETGQDTKGDFFWLSSFYMRQIVWGVWRIF